MTTRIRQLEEDVGVSLFIREGKRLHLSPAGQVLLDYADRLLALAEEARHAVQDPRPRGIFRLGAMESTAAVRLPGPLNEYHRLHPDVVLELRTGNPPALSKALLAHELDAALVTLPIADALFEKVAVFEEEPVIVSAADTPPIGKGKNAYFPRTIIAFEHGCPHRKRLEDWYALRDQMPERTIELGSYHAMLGCVVAGMGVALLPRSVLTTFPGEQAAEGPSPAAGREPRRYLPDLAQGSRFAQGAGAARFAGEATHRAAPSCAGLMQFPQRVQGGLEPTCPP